MKQPAEIIDEYIVSYKELKKQMARADQLFLELIGHPDATDEQILTAAKARRESQQQFKQMSESLRTVLEHHKKYYILGVLGFQQYQF